MSAKSPLRRHWCWLLPVLLLVWPAPEARPQPPPPKKTVRLIIDFGGRAKTKRFDQIPWRQRMTVLDVMTAASKRPGGVKFEYRGSGATALLIQIDGVKNEGARGRNWIYRVNGKLGDRSFGVFRVKARDTIRWGFETYP